MSNTVDTFNKPTYQLAFQVSQGELVGHSAKQSTAKYHTDVN